MLRPEPLFEQAAITAVRQWRFSPTLLNGERVPIVMTVTVGFTSDEVTGSEPVRAWTLDL